MRVAIIGLGRAGGFALSGLTAIPGRHDLVAVDPVQTSARASSALPRGATVVPTVADVVLGGHPDLVIISTPTSVRLAVAEALVNARLAESPVWIEKPMATTAAERAVLRGWLPNARTLLHSLHTRETGWAAQRLPRWTSVHGPICSLDATFQEPHLRAIVARRHSLSGSWLDSGVSALAIATRLVGQIDVVSARGNGLVSADVHLVGRECRVHIRTSWTDGARDKITRLRFGDGAVCTLGHHDGSGLLIADGRILERLDFGRTSMEARYRRMFGALCADRRPSRGPVSEDAIYRPLFDALVRFDQEPDPEQRGAWSRHA